MTTKSTDFEKEIEELKLRIKKSQELEAARKAAEISEVLRSDKSSEKQYRLPYSSNPKPIGEPWRY